ncbi:hypothetical protein F751_1402 [Auxenochlorella protothecoides]|uniref:DNA replication checkpoint mediator MRC1 domain-containing protein n=1 Tax=Auxenochlorella protothecoides TaxID=3075 RepID=A0A087SEI3_AUXPR|nr:hypothetical protein F751_1402 [Auxenochlorella protothecoides]KFM24137.1 hypothetical protein F751_1402 [Auxenochlorella protothecoides]
MPEEVGVAMETPDRAPSVSEVEAQSDAEEAARGEPTDEGYWDEEDELEDYLNQNFQSSDDEEGLQMNQIIEEPATPAESAASSDLELVDEEGEEACNIVALPSTLKQRRPSAQDLDDFEDDVDSEEELEDGDVLVGEGAGAREGSADSNARSAALMSESEESDSDDDAKAARRAEKLQRVFLDMEAELSDEEGAGIRVSDDEDDGLDDGGDLADLIGKERERKRDAAARERLHQEWTAAQDARELQDVLRGLRRGFRRARGDGLWDDEVRRVFPGTMARAGDGCGWTRKALPLEDQVV